MAMAARRERGLLDPDAAPGESPFDHHVYVLASDGDLEEGVTGEASSLAGHQQLGNLIVIYDDNHISIEDDTDISFSEDVADALRGLRLARAARRLDDGRRLRRGRRRAARRDRGRQGRDRPPVVHRAAHDHRLARADQAEHRQGARLRARRRRGRGHQGAARLRPGADLRGRRRGAGPRPRGRSTAAVRRTASGRAASRPGARPTPSARDAARPAERAARCPTAGPTRCPTFDPDPKGIATRAASGKVLDRAGRRAARAVGRLGRPRREQQHDHGGRAVVPPGRTGRPRTGRAARTAAPCTSASASTPWARS